MRFRFKELPGAEDVLRPVVQARLEGQRTVLHTCLLDTGSLHNRFGAWAAEAAGVSLQDSFSERIAVGGVVALARTVPVDLEIFDMTFQAPVSFCEPWPFGFQLLGQEGFFRFFQVQLRASDYSFELHPDPGPDY